jgi:hypothetical protein
VAQIGLLLLSFRSFPQHGSFSDSIHYWTAPVTSISRNRQERSCQDLCLLNRLVGPRQMTPMSGKVRTLIFEQAIPNLPGMIAHVNHVFWNTFPNRERVVREKGIKPNGFSPLTSVPIFPPEVHGNADKGIIPQTLTVHHLLSRLLISANLSISDNRTLPRWASPALTSGASCRWVKALKRGTGTNTAAWRSRGLPSQGSVPSGILVKMPAGRLRVDGGGWRAPSRPRLGADSAVVIRQHRGSVLSPESQNTERPLLSALSAKPPWLPMNLLALN